MGKYVIDETTLRDIADEIREQTGLQEEIAPVDMPTKIELVRSIGYEDGQKAEYDALWDNVKNTSTRIGEFAGRTWTDARFKPREPLTITGNVNYCFLNTGIQNLCKCIEDAGVEVKFENISGANQLFRYAPITHLPTIGFSSTLSNLEYTFNSCSKLQSIEKIIVGENTGYSATFTGCSALEHIIFEGVIGKAISFSDSPLLDDESRQSIIDHLKDLTGATAQTLTFHATVGGKLTQAQKDAIFAKNWTLVIKEES